MDFDELKTELADRGFSDLDATRRGRYINAALHELDRMHLWPWRQKDVTGNAPLTLTDLGPIWSITNEDEDYRLVAALPEDLVATFGDLTQTGTPTFYYRAWSSGSPVLATYPVDTAFTMGVVYWKVATDMSSDSDTPACPTEAQYLLVDLAVRRAAKDKGDWDQYRAVSEEVDRQIADLVVQYPPGYMDDPGVYITSSWDW